MDHANSSCRLREAATTTANTWSCRCGSNAEGRTADVRIICELSLPRKVPGLRALVTLIAIAPLSVGSHADTRVASFAEVGSQLSVLVAEKDRFKPKTLANYKELRDALKSAECDGLKYQYYALDDTLYVVGSSGQGVTIGRHFKFKLGENSVDLSTMQASSNGCLILQSDPSTEALVVTHILSDTPTEFHVLASIVSGKTIYVGTKDAIWKVSGASIDFVRELDV